MIYNDGQLAVVQKQLAIVERIVESWRKQLLPHNPKNFAIYAEGAIEQADLLRAEIDEYLGRKNAKVRDTNATPVPAENPPANVP